MERLEIQESTPDRHQSVGGRQIQKMVMGPPHGGILCDDMGLGKTIQALIGTMGLKLEGQLQGPILIVAPLSTLAQWITESQRHFKQSPSQILAGDWDFVLVTYEFILAEQQRKEKYVAKLEAERKRLEKDPKAKPLDIRRPHLTILSEVYRDIGRPFPLLIIDEAHKIKKWDGKKRAAIKSVPYDRILMLDGTPMSNNWFEIFGLIDLLPDSPFEDLDEFWRIFGPRRGGRLRTPEESQQNRLVKYLLSFTVGRPKLILGLPELVRRDFKFELRRQAAEEMLGYVDSFYRAAGREHNVEDVMVHATKAQQAAAHPALIKSRGGAPDAATRAGIDQIHALYAQHLKSNVNIDDPGYTKELVEFFSSPLARKQILAAQAEKGRKVARENREAKGATVSTGNQQPSNKKRRRLDELIEWEDDEDSLFVPETPSIDAVLVAGLEESEPEDDPENEEDPDDEEDPRVEADQEIKDDPEPTATTTSAFVKKENDAVKNEGTTAKKASEKALRAGWKTRVQKKSDLELYSERVTAFTDCYAQITQDHSKAASKVLGWSKFVWFLDILEEAMKRKHPLVRILRFDGSVLAENRVTVLKSLETSDRDTLLLLQPVSGGNGLNIQCSSIMILAEPDWNRQEKEKVEARSHRRGNPNTVYSYSLFAETSAIDQVTRASTIKKSILINKFMETYVDNWASISPNHFHNRTSRYILYIS
ncbi:hypothetical protein EJ08DRAFT_666637 [Tothia fuscella]|uniref:Uncharacterized protein n=1 Tax=Tothia fuscella TaxID=1048955 RepID=A0A9P4NE21_9PEZI|nr:hypothetical protein EJ08DRAFT_666637 [Tothia fuscella]